MNSNHNPVRLFNLLIGFIVKNQKNLFVFDFWLIKVEWCMIIGFLRQGITHKCNKVISFDSDLVHNLLSNMLASDNVRN